ncbi:MAG: aldo/keto reductase [Burkholderiales bacterium PBB6]|nr:MAG: aldo/keto reductase [Burkholderiales bacterium PBB6]
MKLNAYGRSGLTVSQLGLGAGQIGDAALDEAHVAKLLNTALDLGITLIDTARGYGLSEERIGRHLAHRRAEFVLSTKVGYGIDGYADWTGAVIHAGIDAALMRLQTDVIDIVHLHSCSLDVLRAGEVVEALMRAREAGKIRVAAYAGENDPLGWALAHGGFGGVECSVSLFDQRTLQHWLPAAVERGQGVIAKRALGNAPWRHAERPTGQYVEAYWDRMQVLAYDTTGLPWDEFALRFSAWQPEVSAAITGTTSVENLRRNVDAVNRGPLPEAVVTHLRARFAEVGSQWQGEL